MNVWVYVHTYMYNVIPGNMSFKQGIHVVMDMKEQIWLPNEYIC